MTFSFDLDGVALERPEVFSAIASALQAAGHRVGILTGHAQGSEDKNRERLARLGFPSPDFYVGRRPDEMHMNGTHRKSAAIAELGIDLHFDDFDYGHPDTIRLFSELGQICRVARVTSEREAAA